MLTKLEFQPLPIRQEHGITSIAYRDNVLVVEGWYDMFARWLATVELTDEQRAQLHEATRP